MTSSLKVFEVIKPIYVRLTEKSLLQKCLVGATQNAHESFHGIVWQHCPKEWYIGKEVVDFFTNIAVILFNHGAHNSSLMCLKKVAAFLEKELQS